MGVLGRKAPQQLAGKTTGIKGLIFSIRPEDNDNFDSWLEETLSMGVSGFRRILHESLLNAAIFGSKSRFKD